MAFLTISKKDIRMPISDKLIDQLLDGCDSPEDILGETGLLKQLTKKVAERALEAEMEAHLGYAPNDSAGNNSGNSRNGKGAVRDYVPGSDLTVQLAIYTKYFTVSCQFETAF